MLRSDYVNSWFDAFLITQPGKFISKNIIKNLFHGHNVCSKSKPTSKTKLFEHTKSDVQGNDSNSITWNGFKLDEMGFEPV